eukprot:11197393-Lingulodinium_polyedra.AAC.1
MTSWSYGGQYLTTPCCWDRLNQSSMMARTSGRKSSWPVVLHRRTGKSEWKGMGAGASPSLSRSRFATCPHKYRMLRFRALQ